MRIILTVLVALMTTPLFAQSNALNPKNREHALAYQTLRSIQERSVQESREFCGYLALDAQGQLQATIPTPGSQASCLPKDIPSNWRMVASYHTHGAWTQRYDDEIPSTQDLRGDRYQGINGYIATPGGRLWFHDLARDRVSQLCGLRCLPQDPGYTQAGTDPIRPYYSYRELAARFGE